MGKARQFSSQVGFDKHVAQEGSVAHNAATYFYIKDAFVDVSTGVTEAGLPVLLDSAGLLNTSMIPCPTIIAPSNPRSIVDSLNRLEVQYTSSARMGLIVSTAVDAYAGIRLSARASSAAETWYIDNRGGIETPYNRLAFYHASTQQAYISEEGNFWVNGYVGINAPPTAYCGLTVSFVNMDAAGTGYGVYISAPGRTVTVDETTNLIGLRAAAQDVDIASGKVDSGYRNALRAASYTADPAFLGTLAAQYGLYANCGIATGAGAGTIAICYGAYIYTYAQAGTISNLYQLRLTGSLSGGTVTNGWAIYQDLADLKNYFAGNIGMGTTTEPADATQTLSLKSGTAPSGGIADTFQLYSADVGAVAGQAGPHFRTEGGAVFAFCGATGSMYEFVYQNDSLADDGTVSLPDSTFGILFVSIQPATGTQEGGFWVIQNYGAVVKIAGSTNTDVANTDGKLCVYDAGTYANVRNRLGYTGAIRIVYFYK